MPLRGERTIVVRWRPAFSKSCGFGIILTISPNLAIAPEKEGYMPLRNQVGLKVPASADPPDPRIESFLERLRMAGYTPGSIRIRRAIASAFVAWARRKG